MLEHLSLWADIHTNYTFIYTSIHTFNYTFVHLKNTSYTEMGPEDMVVPQAPRDQQSDVSILKQGEAATRSLTVR